MFSSACVVCHQSAQGLAKGRGAGQLGSFLRQHYTTGSGQANTLAGLPDVARQDRSPATPVRATPADKPAPSDPAAFSRRPATGRRTRHAPVLSPMSRRRIPTGVSATRTEQRSRWKVLSCFHPARTNCPTRGQAGRTPARNTSGEPERLLLPLLTPAAAAAVRNQTRGNQTGRARKTGRDGETRRGAVAAPAVQAEAPRPPRDPAAAHSPLTEELPDADRRCRKFRFELFPPVGCQVCLTSASSCASREGPTCGEEG